MRLRNHPQREKHLFWLEEVEDDLLELVYAASTCLLAISLGEGHGLCLIEAVKHRLPILARDIPVFREVAGKHASYFVGTTPSALADAVDRWLQSYRTGSVVQSDGIPWMNWVQATQVMLDVLLHDKWQSVWQPMQEENLVARYWGSDTRLSSIVGMRIGTELWSSGNAGYLLHGPYLDLKPGHYVAILHGRVGAMGLQGAMANVCVSGGLQVIVETSLVGKVKPYEQFKACLDFVLDKPCKSLEFRVEVEVMSDLMIELVEIKMFSATKQCKTVEIAYSNQHELISFARQDERQTVLAYWANHPALYSEVGYAEGRCLHTTGKAGFLVYGPYESLPAGHYGIEIKGNSCLASDAWMDLVCNQGATVLIKKTSLLENMEQNQSLIDLEFTLDRFVNNIELRIFVTKDTDMSLIGWSVHKKLDDSLV